MITRQFFFSLLFLGVTSLLSAQNDGVPWTQVSKTAEMEVYKRTPQNSKWKEIKLVQYVKAPIEVVVSVIEDVNAYPDWIFKCAESYVVQQISKDELIYYNLTDMPFPFWDRGIVIHSLSEYDAAKDTYYFKSKAVKGYKEVPKDIVQITDFTADWEISELGNGKVRVQSITTVDPAGAIPAWVVNMAVTKGPTKTANRFRARIAEKAKEQE